VEDTVRGANTKEDTLNLQQELIALLGREGFLLRRFLEVTPPYSKISLLFAEEWKYPLSWTVMLVSKQ
jgi:hypothetical protein